MAKAIWWLILNSATTTASLIILRVLFTEVGGVLLWLQEGVIETSTKEEETWTST